MSPVVVSLLFSAGAGTWIYAKLQRYSGNNTRQSVIAAGVSGLIIFIIFLYIADKLIG
jgi:hypothetical protein